MSEAKEAKLGLVAAADDWWYDFANAVRGIGYERHGWKHIGNSTTETSKTTR